ncbi:MAG TPA: UDP-N-acetylmuramate dehydrogenase [Candidatus Saccharimonadia bacterium]
MTEVREPAGLQRGVRLAGYTTIRIGGPADALVVVRTAAELEAACRWAAEQHLPVVVLGEGSNMVVSDEPLHILALKLELPGFEVLDEDAHGVTLRVGGGEHWDDVVRRTVEHGWCGLEALSMIPGTAGAAPVQNAGAYGQETADTLVELEAYDLRAGDFITFSKAHCSFSYRSSRFREADAGRYVITSVTFRLRKGRPAAPTYKPLVKYLADHQIEQPSVAQIREAVMAVRRRILPDPSVVPNAGSFFKNPIISAEQFHELEQDHENVVSFPYGENFKISAGWLLDQCGFKGSEHFGLKIWEHHALVITNPQGADFEHLMKLVKLMQDTVKRRFGIELEQEPLLIR